MARPVTSDTLINAARGDGEAAAGGALPLDLVTLEHPDWDEPVLLVNNGEEGFRLVSLGRTFIAYPFQVTWPKRDPDEPFGGAQMTINNVVADDDSDELLMLALLKGLPSQVRARFETVLATSPDVIEQRTTRLRLTGMTYDETTISGRLEMPDLTGRRAGARFTPDVYRALRAG
jgi:hypothetical protein